ncbi:fimbrillin family protein [Prevotella communis]|uniref:fimbrillin family protein n=1 Tax=Prevotella communis TaxID=2913614 RepID=UPI001EDB5C62|nr:fimbrillin family protein [Prevotella communis]UKK62621.1 fimbrillin family protein [Prevotella communis]UKK65446.1 fimbrillin family protein [Prevotella communis]
MTGKKIIYACMTSLVLAVAACTNEDMDVSLNHTAEGAIDLSVGVEATPARRALTRAGGATSAYYAMKAGTQVRLKVDGRWTGKTPEAISQKTTCKTIAAESGSAVNALSFTEDEMLYWDDYGSGDPNNKTNTDQGLNVLGVAVDGKATAPTIADDSQWESLPWDVVTDGEDVLSGDIIVSNNLTAYQFAKRNDDEAKKMIFQHPLSKLTFNLTAADGFTKGTVGKTSYKFEKDPTVTLTNANTLAGISDAANDYALTKGTVSIASAQATSDGTKATLVAGTTSITDANITVIKQAVVYPGTQLGADDDAVIAIVNADDNIYYIRAKEIHNAIKTIGGHTDFKTLPGYNYIINVTVKKTGIILTASVTKWVDVDSEEVHPEINMTTKVGSDSHDELPAGFNGFDLWLNDHDIAKDYTNVATPTVNTAGEVVFAHTLYWVHHYQHLHFRGIYPTNTVVKEDATDQHQYVEVANGAYDATTFPSNFVMGLPEMAENTPCGNPDHANVYMDQEGICARKAPINLNFRYMMSQVEVTLKSSAEGSDNYVDLTNAEVELVNVGTKGHILLSDRSAVVTTYADEETLHSIDSKHYHGIIVPQLFENSKGKLKFKITVYSDSTKTKKDVYYAEVASIKVKEKGSTASAALTDAWKSGTHYVYDLMITKTEISATASLTDWTTVEGSQEVWF